jgi:hypothetical protein
MTATVSQAPIQTSWVIKPNKESLKRWKVLRKMIIAWKEGTDLTRRDLVRARNLSHWSTRRKRKNAFALSS